MTQTTPAATHPPRVSVSIEVNFETHDFNIQYSDISVSDVGNHQDENGHNHWVVEMKSLTTELQALLHKEMDPQKYRRVSCHGHVQKFDGEWGAETYSRTYTAFLYADGKFDLSF